MNATKKHFWTSLPGILAGVAAIITATAGLYLALRTPPQQSNDQQRLPSNPEPVDASPAYTHWPLIAEDTFIDNLSQWWIGSYPSEELSRFELALVGGKYRWDLEVSQRTESPIEAPFGSATDFYLAVDMRFVASTSNDAQAGVSFGRAANKDYGFRITPGKFFALSSFDGGGVNNVISWTPCSINPNESNRLAVLVEDQKIQLFLNSTLLTTYKDPSFVGGKVGFFVGGEAQTSVVVDFDNFEYRRKP